MPHFAVASVVLTALHGPHPHEPRVGRQSMEAKGVQDNKLGICECHESHSRLLALC